jgi:hypothetical protein
MSKANWSGAVVGGAGYTIAAGGFGTMLTGTQSEANRGGSLVHDVSGRGRLSCIWRFFFGACWDSSGVACTSLYRKLYEAAPSFVVVLSCCSIASELSIASMTSWR